MVSGTAINLLKNSGFSWIFVLVIYLWWIVPYYLENCVNIPRYFIKFLNRSSEHISISCTQTINTCVTNILLPSNYTYIIDNNLIETRSFLRPCFSILFWCPCLSILARLLASIITRWAQSIFSLLLCKYIEQSLRKCYLKGNNFQFFSRLNVIYP